MKARSRLFREIFLVLFAVTIWGCGIFLKPTVGMRPLGEGDLKEVGINPETFKQADGIIQEAIDKKHTPGAVLIVGKDNKIVYEKAYGNRRISDECLVFFHVEPHYG